VRVLQVIQELRTGGAERVLVSVAAGAKAAGHDVAVAAAPGELERELEAERFPLPLIARRPWRLVEATLAVRTAVRSWRPELVHAHNPAMAVAVALALVGRGRPRALVSAQGTAEEDWPAATRLLRLARLPVVACGPGVAAALEERGIKPVATISNAVGPAPPPADRQALEREWGLAPGARLVVAVGRLVEQKHHALAIRALALVPDATLVLVGEGRLRVDLERLAAELGLSGRVVLAGLRSDARAIMGAADAVVLPSHWEGLPLTALEALASGTPLVATAVRGSRELLHDGEDALLVPPGDAEALAEALRRALDDPELASRLASGGLQAAAAASEEAMVAAYLELYERIVA
jgi:glycosyltransferase involved in cell wall biosynthesis